MATDEQPAHTAVLYPGAVEDFYNECKAARDALDQLLLRYRTNTNVVLALATGAATFFGLSSSPKGWLFLLSLGSYAVAAFLAIAIYWPKSWRINVAYDVAQELNNMTRTKLRYDLALGHQQAIAQTAKLIDGKCGQSNKFKGLLIATSLVVIFAGLNGYCESQRSVAPQPIHVVVDKESTQ